MDGTQYTQTHAWVFISSHDLRNQQVHGSVIGAVHASITATPLSAVCHQHANHMPATYLWLPGAHTWGSSSHHRWEEMFSARYHHTFHYIHMYIYIYVCVLILYTYLYSMCIYFCMRILYTVYQLNIETGRWPRLHVVRDCTSCFASLSTIKIS